MRTIGVLLIILLTRSEIPLSPPNLVPEPISLQEHICLQSQIYHVDPAIVFGLVERESDWNPNAISRRHAIGLMQVLLPTAQYVMKDSLLTAQQLLEPYRNIHIGIAYLSYLQNNFKNYRRALSAYERGETRIAKERSIKNLWYVNSILRNSRHYQSVVDSIKLIFNTHK